MVKYSTHIKGWCKARGWPSDFNTAIAFILALFFLSVSFMSSAIAAPVLEIRPITWNVVGLDSNDVTDGPDTFPVGARVCNTGDTTATNVTATFVWDSANAYINLSGDPTINIASLPFGVGFRDIGPTGPLPGHCYDFYWNVVLTRIAAAYDESRSYHIEATATGLPTISTPNNREIFIEHLVSQNRNSVTSISGPTLVYVGGTYQYNIVGATATGGYEQLGFFLNFPNIIFRVLSVSTTYDVPAAPNNTNNSTYADACGWDPDTTSADYLSCVGGGDYPDYSDNAKAGGDPIATTYTVLVLSTGSTILSPLIYDFSGSSFHYNLDFGVDVISVTAVEAPDLVITKTHTGNFTQGQTGATYAVTVTNSGAGPTSGTVSVTDTLPAGLSATAISGTGWTCDLPTLTCTRNDALAALSSFPPITITVNVAIDAPSSLTNMAAVSGGGELNTANNIAEDLTTIDPAADLSITKSDSPDPVLVGQNLTYTITVNNAGFSDASDVAVTDTLPAGVTFTSTSGCENDPNGVPTCNLGMITAGGSKQYTVAVMVTVGAAGTLTNSVSVVSGTADPNDTNNSASENTTVNPSADLAITKTDGLTNAVLGQGITYTITVTNNGPSNVTGASVTDTFPGTLTGVTWTCTASGGATCTASGSGNINDTINIPVGGTVTYTVNATVSASATGTLSNTATVTAPAGITDPIPANNTATDTDTLTQQADLAITKTDGLTNAVPGQGITYTITVTNNGPSNVTGASVTDTFPGTLTGVIWTCTASGGATCTASGSGNISDTINIPIGGTATYTVNATVSTSATGTLSNTATVIAPAGITDPIPANNSATDVTTLTAQPTTVAVPTITGWGMMMLVILQGLGALYYMRRRIRS